MTFEDALNYKYVLDMYVGSLPLGMLAWPDDSFPNYTETATRGPLDLVGC